MKKTARVLAVVFTVVSLFGSFVTTNAATVKNVKNAKYFKTASTKKKAGKLTKAATLSSAKYSKGFVSFKKSGKTVYIRIVDVTVSGSFKGTVSKKAKLYSSSLKATTSTVAKGKSITLTGLKKKGSKAYFKYGSKYIDSAYVTVSSFVVQTATATPTVAPTVVPTAKATPTATPVPTPTPTDIPGKPTSNPETANIFKDYSFTEIRKVDIGGVSTQVPFTVPVVQGDVEFTSAQLTAFEGSLSPWNFNYGSGGGKYMTISADAKRNGNYGIKFDSGYCGGHMKFLGLKNNEDYVFSFWAKKVAEGNFIAYVHRVGLDGGKEEATTQRLTISSSVNEWTQYKIRFNTGAATGGEVLIQYDNTSPDVVYMDDMMMYPYYQQEVSATPTPVVSATPTATPAP